MAHLPRPRLAIHFERFGPYHKARLTSAREQLAPIGWHAIGLETASTDAVYQWQLESHADQAGIQTVFPGQAVESLSRKQIHQSIGQTLSQLNPAAVAIAGWASADAMACLAWCRNHSKPALLMSETRAADGRRLWFKEVLKSWRIKRFQGALVGGASHAAYLRSLGFAGPVVTGYNVVDNAYFLAESTQWRANDLQVGLVSRPYLLASNRFVERKNLGALLDAFSQVSTSIDLACPLDLCLLGDGEQQGLLQQACRDHNLPWLQAAPWEAETPHECSPLCRVLFPGFRQIEELPRFYAHAMAFVHPALSEPWGLVINEAMAAGLPILSSSNVGAAEELLEEGVNGFFFDPDGAHSIAAVLQRFLALNHEEQQAMGQASARLLAERCPTSAFGEGLASLLDDR